MNTVKNKLPESCDYKDVPSPNNEKPIAITVLCYRVVGASGDLTGLASGLKMKEHLLALEGLKGFRHVAAA